MPTGKDLTSVCIPVFNPGAFLKLAIESILSQTYTDFELLIIDDCSTQLVDPNNTLLP
jgi:glycosyltransferase involved in cell wall biosynthesis